MLKNVSAIVVSLLFIVGGIMHFVKSAMYARIVPAWLPYPMFMIYLSGFFEVLGGIGVLIPQFRRAAGIGLILLLLAVFPANINMAIHAADFPEQFRWLIWMRLPMQLLIIAWVAWATNSRRPSVGPTLMGS
jgi:uncharacterized membrane protein